MAKQKSTTCDSSDTGVSDKRIATPANVADLRKELRTAIQARIRPILWGPPGVGKTSMLLSLASDMGFGNRVHVLIGSMCDPTDVGGFPVVSGTEEQINGKKLPVLRFAPRDFAALLAKEGGMLLMDELTCVPASVQAPMLRLMNDLVCGDVVLDPDRVAIVAAANPSDMAANGQELAPPMANRICHLQFPVGPAAAVEWAEGYVDYWGKPQPVSFNGKAVPAAVAQQARSLVAAYIRFKPTNGFVYPKDPSARGLSWPSFRTWDAVGRALAVVMHAGQKPYDVATLATGLVGAGAAAEFLEFLRKTDWPNPEELLKDPKSYRPTGQLDVDYAVLLSVMAVVETGPTGKRLMAAADILAAATQGSTKGPGWECVTPVAYRYADLIMRHNKNPKTPIPDNELVEAMGHAMKVCAPFRAANARLQDAIKADAAKLEAAKKGGK